MQGPIRLLLVRLIIKIVSHVTQVHGPLWLGQNLLWLAWPAIEELGLVFLVQPHVLIVMQGHTPLFLVLLIALYAKPVMLARTRQFRQQLRLEPVKLALLVHGQASLGHQLVSIA
jgi:hypothetical protein